MELISKLWLIVLIWVISIYLSWKVVKIVNETLGKAIFTIITIIVIIYLIRIMVNPNIRVDEKTNNKIIRG